MSGPNWRCIGPWPLCGHPRNTCTASPAYQAAIKVKHASSMTSLDIAGLCERDMESLQGELAFQAKIADARGLITTASVCREAADTLERQAAEIKRLRGALANIAIEAERENGRWNHLKRVIAINARAALTGEDK